MSSRPLNCLLALGFGITYALVGLLGFVVTGDVPFAGEAGGPLVVFDVNGLHDVVHLLIGVALIAASRSARPSVSSCGCSTPGRSPGRTGRSTRG